MSTSQKDYEATAAVINNVGRAHRTENNVATLEIAQGLADYFATDNPNFNRARFISACFKYQQEEPVTLSRVILDTGIYKDNPRHGTITGETPRGRYVWVQWDDGASTQCPLEYLKKES